MNHGSESGGGGRGARQKKASRILGLSFLALAFACWDEFGPDRPGDPRSIVDDEAVGGVSGRQLMTVQRIPAWQERARQRGRPAGNVRHRATSLSLVQAPRPRGVPEYVIPEESLMGDLKSAAPTFAHTRPGHSDRRAVVDVLSIGSETRPEYLAAQNNTWASHADIRHYWGVTERDDYDLNCPSTSDEALDSFVRSCRSPMGWEGNAERLRRANFGLASGRARTEAGWYCAQRRPGRALGWLQAAYRDQAMIPDVLLIVDDDTSLDVERMKQSMSRTNLTEQPFVGAPCTFSLGGFKFAFGGFGTFLNRAALRTMTRPVYCDERREDDEYTRTICANLHMNRIGELDVFEEGDSVFDIFYKYSARRDFCLHSDWVVGYMISFYSGGRLAGVSPRQCRGDPCTLQSMTCHNQDPNDMGEFTRLHNQAWLAASK